jgi:hypothetical protein
MSGPDDVSTKALKNLLEWGIEDLNCSKIRVEALINEVIRERERADKLQLALNQARSDLEIMRAQARGPGPQDYKDGVRYQPPSNPMMGPDGFPQRGII